MNTKENSDFNPFTGLIAIKDELEKVKNNEYRADVALFDQVYVKYDTAATYSREILFKIKQEIIETKRNILRVGIVDSIVKHIEKNLPKNQKIDLLLDISESMISRNQYRQTTIEFIYYNVIKTLAKRIDNLYTIDNWLKKCDKKSPQFSFDGYFDSSLISEHCAVSKNPVFLLSDTRFIRHDNLCKQNLRKLRKMVSNSNLIWIFPENNDYDREIQSIFEQSGKCLIIKESIISDSSCHSVSLQDQRNSNTALKSLRRRAGSARLDKV